MTHAEPLPERLIVRGIDRPVLFVLQQPIYICRDGRSQVTYVAFTPDGTLARTAHTIRDGSWDWLRNYETGEAQPWGIFTAYDGDSPGQRRAELERGERPMKLIPHEVRS